MTCAFLKLSKILEHVVRVKLMPNFAEIVNNCRTNLGNLNPIIIKEISQLTSYEDVLKLKTRSD